ncbi:UbiD family decarboxylase [Streptomyces bobili]|uniref:UbiD family decarboxylase n=1 Tax=Streptomyces bobili TaxID=67280 RepID=UPI00343EB009
MSHLVDLREYIDALGALGDTKTVGRAVSADLEAAAATRRSYELRAPAPFFTKIVEDRIGMRLFGAPAGVSSSPQKPLARLALSVGLPAEAGASDLVEHLVRARGAEPVPPRLVSRDSAPCKQNVLLGDDATLDHFAIPRIHEHDGGRYLNTWGVIVTKMPDDSWTNWSISRIMMLDGKHMTGLVMPPQHLGLIWQAWAERGEPMPYALVQGGAPAIPFVGGIPLPKWMDEAGYIGALHGAPLDVVPCETVDLRVPAHAEVVIEGHLSAERKTVEGPFAEYAGYASDRTSLQPVYSVEAITHRDEPIWPIVAEGRPADEYHTVTGTGRAANVLYDLKAAGLPVTTVWMPFLAAMHWTVVTVPDSWRTSLPGIDSAELVRRIGEVIHNGGGPSAMMPTTFVLDDDIDPSSEADLLWALATRIHPRERRETWEGVVLDFMACYTDEEHKARRGPSVVHDGLLPAWGEGRMRHSSFAQAYPDDIRRKVVDHWND